MKKTMNNNFTGRGGFSRNMKSSSNFRYQQRHDHNDGYSVVGPSANNGQLSSVSGSPLQEQSSSESEVRNSPKNGNERSSEVKKHYQHWEKSTEFSGRYLPKNSVPQKQSDDRHGNYVETRSKSKKWTPKHKLQMVGTPEQNNEPNQTSEVPVGAKSSEHPTSQPLKSSSFPRDSSLVPVRAGRTNNLSENSETSYTPRKFDICEPKSVGPVKLNKPLHVKNREMRKELLLSQNCVEQLELRAGMVLLKKYISPADQMKIVKVCRDLGLGAGGFYQPCFKEGGKMNLHMMCLGKNWDPETNKYEDIRQMDGVAPPCIPDAFKLIVKNAISSSHAVMKQEHKKSNPEDIVPWIQPDICIVNFYAKSGKLGLHKDKDESKESLSKGLPVVSFSIGDSAEFLYGDDRDVEKSKKVVLESGDVLIFGGESRHIFHGVSSIIPDSAPKFLADEANLRPGRLNLTFREY